MLIENRKNRSTNTVWAYQKAFLTASFMTEITFIIVFISIQGSAAISYKTSGHVNLTGHELAKSNQLKILQKHLVILTTITMCFRITLC